MLQQSTGLSAIGPPWSQLTAYDLNKGTILWQIPDGDVASLAPTTGTGSHSPRGGVVATGGGLLFVGTSSDRKLRAYDADTGKVLWAFDLPAAQEGVPAVYSVGGKQYVAIAVGGKGLFSQNMQLPDAGPGQYMVFTLDAGWFRPQRIRAERRRRAVGFPDERPVADGRYARADDRPPRARAATVDCFIANAMENGDATRTH